MKAVLLGLAASGFAMLACGGSNTPAGEPSSDGGDERGGSSDAATNDHDGGHDSPVGCPLKSTGFKTAKAVRSVARGAGSAEWLTPAGALVADDGRAIATLASAAESALLELADFGFEIPANALTYGIEIELARTAPQGGVVDGQVNVHIDGKTSRYKYVDGPWPKTIVGVHHYGQAVDTWGVDLDPADVNVATFRVSIWVKKAADASGAPTAEIDALRAAIHYCER